MLIDLTGLTEDDLGFVNQALGEVSMNADDPSPICVQEAIRASVWRMQHYDPYDQVIRDTIETDVVADIVRNTACNTPSTACDTSQEKLTAVPLSRRDFFRRRLNPERTSTP